MIHVIKQIRVTIVITIIIVIFLKKRYCRTESKSKKGKHFFNSWLLLKLGACGAVYIYLPKF